jgi:transitional endoplasmic reticulum ATPase
MNTIEGLKEALNQSPQNAPLRMLLAESLLSSGKLDEAEEHYNILIKTTVTTKARIGLATVFYMKGKYSACNVILEELLSDDGNHIEALVLYAKGLLKENEISKAVDVYSKVLEMDPTFYNEELDSKLKVRSALDVNDVELEDDRFLEKPAINFDDVGGMEQVKKEIDLKIIKPALYPEL